MYTNGCEYCKPDKDGYVTSFGAFSIHNGEIHTGHCKPRKINFCPMCSTRLNMEGPLPVQFDTIEKVKEDIQNTEEKLKEYKYILEEMNKNLLMEK